MAAVAVTLLGCGGGGGTDGGTPSGPPPNPLYVNVSRGNDSNSGGDPDDALQTVSRAALIALSGYTIIVAPGTYQESITTDRSGGVPDGITFFADTRGTVTGGRAGAVIIEPPSGPAFDISNTNAIQVGNRLLPPIIDGFTVRGASDAGILISGGDRFIVQSCVVSGTAGDGIRIQGTSNAVVFNNLVYDNSDRAIAIVQGAQAAKVLSNTLVRNDNRGITVGNTAQPAPGSTIRNNIVQNNGGDFSIKIFPPGDADYSGGFNIVLPDTYDPTRIERQQDLHTDALFVNPAANDFHLQPTSPAINRGAALNTDSMQNPLLTIDPTIVSDPTPGSPGDEVSCIIQPTARICEVQLTDYLNDRTTTGGNNCDQGGLDIGFHTLPSGTCTGAGG